VVRDKETFQVMKQYMANGNFTRSSSSVTANASLAFVGNIDDSVDSIVNSPIHALQAPAPGIRFGHPRPVPHVCARLGNPEEQGRET